MNTYKQKEMQIFDSLTFSSSFYKFAQRHLELRFQIDTNMFNHLSPGSLAMSTPRASGGKHFKSSDICYVRKLSKPGVQLVNLELELGSSQFCFFLFWSFFFGWIFGYLILLILYLLFLFVQQCEHSFWGGR